ncbi:hypothetical protein L2E82_40108 [Cichorium intybus]|uniref:Uncharacterized protein n=1 Tax=Cichorium intybus TaxID=13427 RepID=A0ACB9AK60_CICIN|nr:hypothetical protein L2E82_40108 [Cichorium intybus]
MTSHNRRSLENIVMVSSFHGCENITPVPSFYTDRMELISHTHGILKDLQVETVADILPAMNATSWRFNGDTCNIDTISEVPKDLLLKPVNGEAANSAWSTTKSYKFFSGSIPNFIQNLMLLSRL